MLKLALFLIFKLKSDSYSYKIIEIKNLYIPAFAFLHDQYAIPW